MATEKNTENGAENNRPDDVIARAVEIGYEVIEEHIREGKRVAEGLTSGRSEQPRGAQGDRKELIERLLHFYTDLGSLCFELMESIIRNPGVGDLLRPQPNGSERNTNAASSHNGASAQAAAIPTEVTSVLPVRVTLSLDERSTSLCSLGVHELRALDESKPSLKNVSFESGSDGRQTLHVRVPDNQPPGIYSGVVIDTKTNEPRGTLSVLVRGDVS